MPVKQRESRSAGPEGTGRTEPMEGAGMNGAPAAAGSNLMIDLDFVRGLIEAIDKSGIDSLELQRAGTRIRISKTPTATVVTSSAPAPAAGNPLASPAAAPAAAPAVAATEPVAAPASNLVEVKSPMVGTFYRAPAPEAPPYVEVGSHIGKGQTLCILEAMKLMNELESEVDGIVREVLVDDSDPIEYGQVLFRIEPSGGRS
jgi:acetyl-CoA carboxylase biotin carboxyl carrier protein